MKKILVTGGAGFIGHHLSNELHKDGYDVTVFDINHSNRKLLNPDIKFSMYDIRNPLPKEDFDTVFHLAALISVPNSFDEAEDYISTDIWGTYNVMNTYKDARIINISSSAAEGKESVYGIAKESSEKLANLSIFPKSVSVRLMNIYGEGQLKLDMAVPAFAYALKHNEQAKIFGDGTILRDYTYVHDLVDELIKIGEGDQYGVIETGYGTPIMIKDLYVLMAKLANKKENYEFYPPRLGDVPITCAREIMEEPKYGFEEGLKRTIDWYFKEEGF